MMLKRVWLAAAAALLAGALSARAVEGPKAPPPSTAEGAPQPPVHISADAAEYLDAENLAIFTGKVVAVQGDATLTAERMEVRFTPAPAEGGEVPAPGATGTGQRVSSITADRSVTVRQLDPESGKERYATGEHGVYQADRRLVTLTGSPRLWEGKNVVVGEIMDFYLDEKKVLVRGKVNLTLYPDETKPGGKKEAAPK